MKLKSSTHQVFRTTYKRDYEKSRWVNKVVHGTNQAVYNQNPLELIEDRITTAVPNGAVVYISKHVKYPRSHLRTYLKTIDARITIKPDAADIVIYDPLWMDLADDYRESAHLIEVYDPIHDETHTGLLARVGVLRNIEYPYTLVKPERFCSFTGMPLYDHNAVVSFVEFLQANSSAQFISHDDMFNQATAGVKIDNDEFHTMARTIFADQGINNAETYLGALSRYSIKDNTVAIAALLMMMRLRYIPYQDEFRKYLRSTFYHNLLKRIPEHLGKVFGNKLSMLRGSSFIGGYSHVMPFDEQYNGLLAHILLTLHGLSLTYKIDFPKEFVKFYVQNTYRFLNYHDRIGDMDLFKREVASQMLVFLDGYDKYQIKPDLYFNTTNTKQQTVYANQIEDRLLNLDYYRMNREFIRKCYNEMLE